MYSRFEAALGQAIADGRIAGGVALTVDRGGVAYEHSAGLRQAGGGEAMTPDTPVAGPAIVESSFTTVVVDPGAAASRTTGGGLRITF